MTTRMRLPIELLLQYSTLRETECFCNRRVVTPDYWSNFLRCNFLRLAFGQSDSRQRFRRRILSRPHAIGHADAAIAIARERQPRQRLQQHCDSLQAVLVADAVLRHRALPAVNA